MRFLLKHYGDEVVVYDSASGDTHYLTLLAWSAYQLCHTHDNLAKGNIAEQLSIELAIPVTTDFLLQIDEALTNLRRIGLLTSS